MEYFEEMSLVGETHKLNDFLDHLNSNPKNIQFTTEMEGMTIFLSLTLTCTINLMAHWVTGPTTLYLNSNSHNHHHLSNK
jgi:hypothetical protein